MRRLLLVATTLCACIAVPTASAHAAATADTGAPSATHIPTATPTASGRGGGIATVDVNATAVGLDVLRRGGNAVDAAVAAAATLGVTEPFSSGIGGGGFFVFYQASTGRVSTIDGRETGPATMTPTIFVDPATSAPYAFAEARVSGLSVGVPGTLATWQEALRRWGTRSLPASLAPAIGVARKGFDVDQTFQTQIADNAVAFGQFGSTRDLYLPGGQPPAIGSTFRNPDLARTYELIAREGTDAFYGGPIGRDIVATVAHPPVADTPASGWPYPIRAGGLSLSDLASYQAPMRAPTHVGYRGLDVYGMATPSSGGSTVGEALNILERANPSTLDRTQALHRYLEASALSFADRNRYVGADTPRSTLDTLLSDSFAGNRACRIDATHALTKPVAPGSLTSSACASVAGGVSADPGTSTTNLTVADRWGNVVEYTFTIEQIGGNAMVVPGRGFLLNNELTDFNFTPTQGSEPDPNLPAAGKRPRSSISPTIVLRHGTPWLAVGSPGGSTIITTVLQILLNRIDFGMSLPDAIAAPRASQRNTASVTAEPAFISGAGGLTALGHTFTPMAEIGAATGIELSSHGRLVAAAEPTRRGGGAAAVVTPLR